MGTSFRFLLCFLRFYILGLNFFEILTKSIKTFFPEEFEATLEFVTDATGKVTALVGRSGCGKTTLLNLCGAMDYPTSGEVEVAGLVTSGLVSKMASTSQPTSTSGTVTLYPLTASSDMTARWALRPT